LRDFCESGKNGEKSAIGAKLPTPQPPEYYDFSHNHNAMIGYWCKTPNP